MATLSDQELWDLAQRHFGDLGPEVVAQMVAIAKAESGGNPGAYNGVGLDNSHGLWQINTHPKANPDLAHFNLNDPEQNAQAARIILDRQGAKAWTTYTGGQYRQYLPATPQEQPSQTGGTPMVTQSPSATAPVDVAQGTGLFGLILQALGLDADIRNQDRYYEADMKDAERQYQLDLQRYGLSVADLNFKQRMAEADTKLQSLGLLSSLSGPGDWVKYNHVINNLDAPAGEQRDPFGLAGGINQPVAGYKPRGAQSVPTGGVDTTDIGRPASAFPEPSNVPPPTVASTASTSQSGPIRPFEGNFHADSPKAESLLAQGATGQGLLDLMEVANRQAGVYANAGKTNPAVNAGAAVPKMATGGITDENMVMTGDPKPGSDKPNEELVIDLPNDGGLLVIPKENLIGKRKRAAEAAPHAATGGAFPSTYHDPAGFSNLPAVQQVIGNQSTRTQQGARGEDLGPFGKSPISYQNFMSLLPSAQAMVAGYINTPTGQGGLGGVFEDELERARRAAATGVSTGAAMYGG